MLRGGELERSAAAQAFRRAPHEAQDERVEGCAQRARGRESLAQRDNWGHGGPWQEGVRVPLILRLPGNERAGERIATPVHLVDIATTVLAFAGLPADPALPGCSLLTAPPPERVVSGGQDPVHYLVRWPRKVTRAGDRVGWFDLAKDPGEKDPQRESVAEFEALRAAMALDPASFHAPGAAAALTPDDRAELEATGNLRLETAKAYAATGVDYLSVGGLTHSSPILDIALDLRAA